MSQDLFDLLNIPDSPDQHLFSAEAGDQPSHDEGGSASVPHSPTPFTLPPASKKSFQKDVLKLMMDGIKISLVNEIYLFGKRDKIILLIASFYSRVVFFNPNKLHFI